MRFKWIILLFCAALNIQQSTAQVPVEKEAHHKIVLENEWVRVLDGKVPPHDTTPAHIHSANSVVIFLSKTKLGIQIAGQQPTITPVAPGDLRYVNYGLKPVTHIVWDQGDSILHFLVVELKKPAADGCPVGPLNTSQPASLPASCPRMVVIPTTGAFTFYPPNTPAQLQTGCILLQL